MGEDLLDTVPCATEPLRGGIYVPPVPSEQQPLSYLLCAQVLTVLSLFLTLICSTESVLGCGASARSASSESSQLTFETDWSVHNWNLSVKNTAFCEDLGANCTFTKDETETFQRTRKTPETFNGKPVYYMVTLMQPTHTTKANPPLCGVPSSMGVLHRTSLTHSVECLSRTIGQNRAEGLRETIGQRVYTRQIDR